MKKIYNLDNIDNIKDDKDKDKEKVKEKIKEKTKEKENKNTLKTFIDIIFFPKKMRKNLEYETKDVNKYFVKIKSVFIYLLVLILSFSIYHILFKNVNEIMKDNQFPNLVIQNGNIDIERQIKIIEDEKAKQNLEKEIIKNAINNVNGYNANVEKEKAKAKATKTDKDKDKEKVEENKNIKLEDILKKQAEQRVFVQKTDKLNYIYIRDEKDLKKLSEVKELKEIDKNEEYKKELDELFSKVKEAEKNQDKNKETKENLNTYEKAEKIIKYNVLTNVKKELEETPNKIYLVIKKENVNVFSTNMEIPYLIETKNLIEIGKYGSKTENPSIITKDMVLSGINSFAVKSSFAVICAIIFLIILYILLSLYLWIGKIFGETVLKLLKLFKIFNLDKKQISNITVYALTIPMIFLCINLAANMIYAISNDKNIKDIARFSIILSIIIYIIQIILFAMIHKYEPLKKEKETGK